MLTPSARVFVPKKSTPDNPGKQPVAPWKKIIDELVRLAPEPTSAQIEAALPLYRSLL
jgi:hypothetical protein